MRRRTFLFAAAMEEAAPPIMACILIDLPRRRSSSKFSKCSLNLLRPLVFVSLFHWLKSHLKRKRASGQRCQNMRSNGNISYFLHGGNEGVLQEKCSLSDLGDNASAHKAPCDQRLHCFSIDFNFNTITTNFLSRMSFPFPVGINCFKMFWVPANLKISLGQSLGNLEVKREVQPNTSHNFSSRQCTYSM